MSEVAETWHPPNSSVGIGENGPDTPPKNVTIRLNGAQTPRAGGHFHLGNSGRYVFDTQFSGKGHTWRDLEHGDLYVKPHASPDV